MKKEESDSLKPSKELPKIRRFHPPEIHRNTVAAPASSPADQEAVVLLPMDEFVQTEAFKPAQVVGDAVCIML